MREISLNVPQGVGDIFWIYQKMSPHFDRINFNICVLGRLATDDPIQIRAKEWVKLFPKTGAVDFKRVSDSEYRGLITATYPMSSFVGYGLGPFDYSLNRPLEEGVRIEQIDPTFAMEWGVDVKTEPVQLPYEQYLCLYVSGSFRHPAFWSIEKWIELVVRLFTKWNKRLPIIIIGAPYDIAAVAALDKTLDDLRYEHKVFVDLFPVNVNHILKNASLFIGFQSGLSILADNFDVPQIMLYVPRPDYYLAPGVMERRLMYSWAKMDNINRRVYNPFTFAQSPEEVVNSLTLMPA